MLKIITRRHYIDLREAADEAVANYVKKVGEVAILRRERETYIDKISELAANLSQVRTERNEAISARDKAVQLAIDIEKEYSALSSDPEFQHLRDRLMARESEIDFTRRKLANANAEIESLKIMIAERDKRVEKLILKLEERRHEKTTSTKRHSETE